MPLEHPGEGTADTVRLALVGYGRWGSNVARDMAACFGVQLTHLVDIDENALKEGGLRHPGAALVEGLQECLGSVDAVAICTPARHHFEHASWALEAGKHVFLEKPMAMSGRDALVLQKMAKESGRVLMVGHQMLHHALFKKLCDDKAFNRHGMLLEADRAGGIDLETEPDVLWAYGPHDLAMFLRLLGEEPEHWKVLGLERRREDGVVVRIDFKLEFASGASGRITLDCRTDQKRRQLELVSSERKALFDDVPQGGTLEVFQGDRPLSKTYGKELSPPLQVECRDFVRRVISGQRDDAGVALSVAVTRILEEISESIGR